ncbi:50S ribosomal protein L21 [Gimesia sp.]|uniref:50S ribosomal protein L21 n=1 Tax=Gimesia sp. TaxID=2024833 RepID=UPI003A90CE55
MILNTNRIDFDTSIRLQQIIDQSVRRKEGLRMFVVIEDGNRQYTIQEGETLTIDYRATAKAGDPITFENVLLANGGGASSIGTPTIEGASVEAEVVQPELKGVKLEVQKFRRRKNSRRHTGHRQKYTTVQIKTINVPGLEVVESAAAEETEPATAEG